MGAANYLTLLRILISPIFFFVYLKYEMLGISLSALPYLLLLLYTLLEVSDALDGYLARRYNQVTELGKLLDPMADSIARTSVFLTFTVGVIQLPVWLVFVFLYRDSVISTLRTICALRGFTLAARPSGKIKAVIQAISVFSILILMIPFTRGWILLATLQDAAVYIVAVPCFYALLSMVDYLVANRDYIRRILKPDV